MTKTSRRKTLAKYVAAQPRKKTQNEIARELGLTPTQLSAYLTGRLRPGSETALRLSREFGFDLEALLDPPQEEAAS